MAKGRNAEKRSKLAGERFGIAVEQFTSSFEDIIKKERWASLVDYFELKQIRRWVKDGLPLKRVDQVAEFFGLEARAFIDDRIDERDFRNALYRCKQKVIDAGKKRIPPEPVLPPVADSGRGQYTPDEFRNTFNAFIEERLCNFCGRQFVFEALDAFIEDPGQQSGYFLITGDPGIGKSALTAKLVNERHYLHHFNIALQSINRPGHFLKNICSQLIGRFALPHPALPPEAVKDGTVLNGLLAEAAAKLAEDEKLVIAIDALDEVDGAEVGDGANPLYLPPSLPDGVYVVATSRRSKETPFMAMNLTIFDLEANSPDNREDVALYIEKSLENDGIQEAVAKWKLAEKTFVDTMVEKSEGNFMYLRHVLPAIGKGKFRDGGIDEIPQGLLNYYRHHWKKMRGKEEENFDTLYQPVVCILATVKEAVSLELVHRFTGIEPMKVKQVVDQWFEFLHTERCGESGDSLFRVYHKLFQEFLYTEVEPGLKRYHKMIAEYYLGQIGMDENGRFAREA